MRARGPGFARPFAQKDDVPGADSDTPLLERMKSDRHAENLPNPLVEMVERGAKERPRSSERGL